MLNGTRIFAGCDIDSGYSMSIAALRSSISKFAVKVLEQHPGPTESLIYV